MRREWSLWSSVEVAAEVKALEMEEKRVCREHSCRMRRVFMRKNDMVNL